MKFVHIVFHFEFAEHVERILDREKIRDYVRYAMVAGKDQEGKHFGNKVFPGSTTVFQAQVPDDKIEGLVSALKEFREEKQSHRHMTVAVMPVEIWMGWEEEMTEDRGQRTEDRGQQGRQSEIFSF